MHLLLLGGLGGLDLVPAAQHEQPQVDGEPVRQGGGHQRATGHIVGGGAAHAQHSGQGQEARVPKHGAGTLVGVHLTITQAIAYYQHLTFTGSMGPILHAASLKV